MGTRAKADIAAILEASYAFEHTDELWLRGVLDASAPLLDHGPGVMAFSMELSERSHTFRSVALSGGDEAWQSEWRSNWWEPFVSTLSTESLRFLFDFGAVSSAAMIWEAAAAAQPTLDARLRALQRSRGVRPRARSSNPGFRFPDSLNVMAIEGGGSACAIVANRKRVMRVDELAKVRADFARVAGHLSASLRLQRKLGRGIRTGDAEAIVDPRTLSVVHAEGVAGKRSSLDALRSAARDVDRARSGSRRYVADEALSLWRCLVEQRWTLADVFETDGRRYVVAVSNAPAAGCAALSEREAQVVQLASFGRSNKEIAYELGVTPSTVATLLGRAGRKVGAKTVVELIARARAAPSADGSRLRAG